ncbi:MAG: hypothetical protein HY917_03110 [Candidatus Diapherotrites archaeon]|nr:hypothetical protein [Candidatus Diapherotrites archaeon]
MEGTFERNCHEIGLTEKETIFLSFLRKYYGRPLSTQATQLGISVRELNQSRQTLYERLKKIGNEHILNPDQTQFNR